MKSHIGRLLLVLLLVATGCSVPWSGQNSAARLDSIGPAGEATVLPGDRVALRIWNEPEMSDTFTVAENGSVALPLVGMVPTDGKSVVQFQDTLRFAFAEYLRNPSVDITVLRRVGISGEVREPGIYMIDLTMTLPDLIARAGGLTEAGNPDRIILRRGVQEIRFRRSGGERFVSAQLRSGDQVEVGELSLFQQNPLAVMATAVPLASYVISLVVSALR